MLEQLTSELKRRDGVVVLGPLGFENAYALAMRADRAKALRHRAPSTIWPPTPPSLTLGSDLEFLSRPEWTAVRGAYGLKFRKARPPTSRPSCTAP